MIYPTEQDILDFFAKLPAEVQDGFAPLLEAAHGNYRRVFQQFPGDERKRIERLCEIAGTVFKKQASKRLRARSGAFEDFQRAIGLDGGDAELGFWYAHRLYNLAERGRMLAIWGLYPVTAFNGAPFFPGPWEPIGVIMNHFAVRSSDVLLCAALQFGASIPLGVFTATIVSRLRFLGVRAAGTEIALFGGFLTAFTMMVSSSVLWAMTYPGVAQDGAVVQTVYRIQFALGGPGFSVPFGLLIAGVSVTSWFYRLLPKWLLIAGFLIAAAGVLSWFDVLVPEALPLIPLTRFPGFLWLIAAGFLLPGTIERDRTQRP